MLIPKMNITDFREVKKNCLTCGALLKLNVFRDIKRKRFCSYKCSATYTHKIGHGTALPIQSLETRAKAARTTSIRMKLGLIPKPPRQSLETMRKVGLKQRGKNHPRWVSDRSKVKGGGRYNSGDGDSHGLWRKEVFQRDHFTCQFSGESGGKLEAHHIRNWSSTPEARFDINNGITFSKKVHKRFHKLFGRKNTTIAQLVAFFDERLDYAVT